MMKDQPTLYKEIERILDEESAWIARPNVEVTKRIAAAAAHAGHRMVAKLSDESATQGTKEG